MSPLGIGPRDIVSLARDRQGAVAPKGPIIVTGVLVEQLAREVAAGGDASLVRTEGDPAHPAAVVRMRDADSRRAALDALIADLTVAAAARGLRPA